MPKTIRVRQVCSRAVLPENWVRQVWGAVRVPPPRPPIRARCSEKPGETARAACSHPAKRSGTCPQGDMLVSQAHGGGFTLTADRSPALLASSWHLHPHSLVAGSRQHTLPVPQSGISGHHFPQGLCSGSAFPGQSAEARPVSLATVPERPGGGSPAGPQSVGGRSRDAGARPAPGDSVWGSFWGLGGKGPFPPTFCLAPAPPQ